jgi:hypothetical protein
VDEPLRDESSDRRRSAVRHFPGRRCGIVESATCGRPSPARRLKSHISVLPLSAAVPNLLRKRFPILSLHGLPESPLSNFEEKVSEPPGTERSHSRQIFEPFPTMLANRIVLKLGVPSGARLGVRLGGFGPSLVPTELNWSPNASGALVGENLLAQKGPEMRARKFFGLRSRMRATSLPRMKLLCGQAAWA